MAGREKPLILQNGMPIPQEYDKDLGDWTEYSNEHIKAIKAELALVKAELQTIKTNQLSGDQKVQLSGTDPLLHEYSFNDLLSNTSRYVGRNTGSSTGVAGVDLKGARDVAIVIKNNHDVAIELYTIYITHTLEAVGLAGAYEPIIVNLNIPVGGTLYVDKGNASSLAEYIGVGLFVNLRRSTAPATGDVEIKVLGRW